MKKNKSINLYDDSSSEEFNLSLNYSENYDDKNNNDKNNNDKNNNDINNDKNNNDINNDETNNLIISNLNNKQTEQLDKDIQLSILVSALLEIVFVNKKNNMNKILNLLQKYNILDNNTIDYNYSDIKFRIKHLINSLITENNIKTITNKTNKTSKNDDDENNNIIVFNKKNNNLENKYSYNFIELENIGNGSYGSVYKVYHKYEKNLYAIKKVFITNELIKDNFDIFREIQLFSKLNHKNIVRYYSSWLSENDSDNHSENDSDNHSDNHSKNESENDSKNNNSTLYIQMELCDITFRDYINNSKRDDDIDTRIFYFKQIVEGIKYLHDNNIIHRDIKPSNILFIDNTIKICDFGLAKSVNNSTNIINGSSEVGTSFYRAPEIDSNNYNNKIDVYSLGIILIELLLQNCKTQLERMMYMKEILENKIKPLPYLITNKYDEIIINMINIDVVERYNINNINFNLLI